MARKTFVVESYEVIRARRMTIGSGAAAFGSQIVCRGGDGVRFVLFFLNAESSIPDNTYNPDAKWATSYLEDHLFDTFQDLLRHEKPVYAHLDSASPSGNRLYTSAEPIGETEEAPSLSAWLADQPALRNALVWEDDSGPHAYDAWSTARKADLAQAFEAAWFAAPDGLADPLSNQAVLADDDNAIQILSASDSWQLYRAYVAHSLAVEAGHTVGWSVAGYSPDQLALLFDSRKIFSWSSAQNGYRIDSGLGIVLPAPPRYTHDFLVREDLIAHSRFHTIGKVLDWCRDNMVHFLGGWETGNLEAQWQYRGFPPVSRVLEGTLNTEHPDWGVAHRTGGCHGTLGFLRAVLRCVNIPVNPNHECGHALPHFPTENRYMSHGDDPYNRMSKGTPDPFPATSLMIDAATYNAWFTTHPEPCDNIGRNVRELALVHLPTYVLERHCLDVASGRDHVASLVAEIFAREYTVAELEAQNLWDRIEAKIAGHGGCANLP